MARRRSARKRKRFEAPSISALLPGTLEKGKPRKPRGRGASRKRQRAPALSVVFARWGISHYIAALLAIAALASLFILLSDDRFIVETPTVSGNQLLDAGEIIRRAGLEQTNIFLVRTDEVARRLSLIPQVKEARVRLGLPNRAEILITERQPALNYVREGATYWVDEEGRIFPASEFRIDLPVLLDDDSSASVDEQHLVPGLSQAIIFLHASMPELNEFNYRRDFGLYFLSPEGWRVYLGDGQHMEKKLRKWRTIRQQLLQDGGSVKVVDLRFEKVYVKR